MKRLLVVLLCLGLCGCATIPQIPIYHVSVDAINNNEPTLGKSCVVTPGMKDVHTDDLQFIEFANYVKRALTLKGYVLSDDVKTADIDVFLGYGISEPKEHTYSYAMPVWGQTGISSASTMGSISSYGNISSTTTYTPSYGITGAVPMTGSYVTYTRQISLVAYDLKTYREKKNEKQLWKTEIASNGYSGDLRRVFPILIAGAAEYIGQNTGQKVEVSLTEDDNKVLAIKSINPDQIKTSNSSEGPNYLNIVYQPSQGLQNLFSTISPVKINLINFVDKRKGDKENKWIGYKNAAFNVRMGDVYSQQPISEILRDAIQSELIKGGHKIVTTGEDFIIEGSFDKFYVDADATLSYWDITGETSFTLRIVKPGGAKAASFGPYSGKRVQRTFIFPTISLMTQVIRSSVSEAIKNLVSDKQLVEYFKNK